MRKFVLLLTVLLMVNGKCHLHGMSDSIFGVNGQSTNFPYLTFETTEGAKASIPVSSLTMTIDGNTLTVGDQQFTLTNLAKMYFSTTDETAAGIENVNDNESYTEIYDLQGKRLRMSDVKCQMSDIKGQLPKGVYIVKTKEKTYKLMVR